MVILRQKCVVCGTATVGKSAMAQVFFSDGTHYPKNYAMTVGAELTVKSVNIPDTKDSVELYLVDTAGQKIFASIGEQYWEHAGTVAVVFDVTNVDSLEKAADWCKVVRKVIGNNLPGVLIGNKIDLETRRKVSSKEGKEMAKSLGLKYFECSALKAQNVETPFHYLAAHYHSLYNSTLGIGSDIFDEVPPEAERVYDAA